MLRAPIPLLVQYLLDDDLFPLSGMRAADAQLAGIYDPVSGIHRAVLPWTAQVRSGNAAGRRVLAAEMAILITCASLSLK
ncbi:hypothetical protein LWC34_07665 [Kibdelosporangium philippinense]|uniref:Uncharacterized protein n=1 Tax=Kibdelosporangium philippinense TaxID=211113 RepID=A0ABS8Z5J4_9PSEU|nr:hypothetical protein [Kibdelosporangium philippinense]MCE7002707.1 hypothetical protein [Kibdelosporangium philippinense]